VRLAAAHGVPVELLEAEQPGLTPEDPDISTFLGQRVSPPEVRVHPVGEEVIPWALFKKNQDLRA